ncbi:MAG TPA: helix-turn-helix domain-containing protein [Candidatus Acidoferrum sp.]|nr:helix-turn-helix domain-containing protein [Candidatus Acidoferrum sp.]
MADDSEFLSRLITFGLSEKEAHLYLHLLKYGPKPPSLLAKSLNTYRGDVFRTLTRLVDKGMVNRSLKSPTVYSAMELNIALDATLEKHKSELHEKEVMKQEIEELSNRQRVMLSDECFTFKIIKSMKDVMTMTLSNLASIEKEWTAVVPAILTVFSSLYVLEGDREFIDRGGRIRFITDITYPYVGLIQQHLDIGIEARHFDKYMGVLFSVFDRKVSMSAISADVKHISLNEPVSVLWTDDPTYAEYLTSTFELLWDRATPAAKRLEELLKEGPRQN